MERFIADGHEVHISSPYGERIDKLKEIGAIFHDINISRHGMNPLSEIKLLKDYKLLYKNVKPDIVFSFTIKPNVYGGIIARRLNVPFVANITGLGMSIENGGFKQKISLFLYRYGLLNAQKVFFQNQNNLEFFIRNKVVTSPYELLPGSGVNVYMFPYTDYPLEDKTVIFTTIGRIMKDKGTDELLEAAKILHDEGVNVQFQMIGFFDSDYKDKVMNAVENKTITYIEQQMDVRPFISRCHAIIQPSHHEGMSNVILEASSMGRPVIASDIPGCREAFDDGVSGLSFTVGDSLSLVKTIKRFLSLSIEEKAEMGKKARFKMEKEFNREFVVYKYVEEVNKLKECNT